MPDLQGSSASDANIRLKLRFKDRVGIVADISAGVAGRGFSIRMMEVIHQRKEAHIYMELEHEASVESRRQLMDILQDVADLREIGFIDILPRQERENRFRVVLDNIRDGVLSIDGKGRITTMNAVACKAFNCKDQEMIGRHVNELNLPDTRLLDCLEGKQGPGGRRHLITPASDHAGRYQFFATERPIRDQEGGITGAVLIATDVREIRRLARTMGEPDPRVDFSDIIGGAGREGDGFRAAIEFARRIAPSDSIVSLRGESGTGKEVFARAIHTASGRQGPFVPINCAALPEQLLESELFGYAGGSFTGGRREGKPGLFEIARDGSVFLDEIAEMAVNCQAKILRLIQERSVRRIGGEKEIPINARIITATSRNLEDMVEEGGFRRDLYYRINVLPLHIPPLRRRRSDIAHLAEHFLFRLSTRLLGRNLRLTDAALKKLESHDWPGNVRELKNVIERAAVLCDGERIQEEFILFSFEVARRAAASTQSTPSVGLSLEGEDLPGAMARVEKEIIVSALKAHPSVRSAARALGVSHTSVLRKIRRYGLVVERISAIGLH